MNRTITSLLLLSGVFAVAVPAATAQAQCSDGWVCADLSVGASFGFGVGIGTPPPRQEQVIIVQQPPPPPVPPPVVYVQPQQPPPPPQVVYVQQPAPPPTVVYQPAPAPVATVVQPQPEREPGGFGLHGQIGGMLTPDLAMGGVHGAFRWRPNMGHFALDLGLGLYGGTDYNGLDRVEVPLTLDALFYINPQSRFQIYGVAGVGLSFAHAEDWNEFGGVTGEPQDYAYVGGQAGVGAELKLGRWWAINADVRGFIREEVSAGNDPEFSEPFDVDGDGNIGPGEERHTNTSGGFTLNVGATLYW
jgi:hypothetical protein